LLLHVGRAYPRRTRKRSVSGPNTKTLHPQTKSAPTPSAPHTSNPLTAIHREITPAMVSVFAPTSKETSAFRIIDVVFPQPLHRGLQRLRSSAIEELLLPDVDDERTTDTATVGPKVALAKTSETGLDRCSSRTIRSLRCSLHSSRLWRSTLARLEGRTR